MTEWTRRRFVGTVTGALAGAAGNPPAVAVNAERWRKFPSQPDFVIILTDQERHHMHWPRGLRDRLMPSWARLARTGLTFNRASCSSSECSPSRACLVTAQYSIVNGVPRLLSSGLPTVHSLPNVASVLAADG